MQLVPYSALCAVPGRPETSVPDVAISGISSKKKNVLRNTTRITYMSCYMFRHRGAIFRELWQLRGTSQPANVFCLFLFEHLKNSGWGGFAALVTSSSSCHNKFKSNSDPDITKLNSLSVAHLPFLFYKASIFNVTFSSLRSPF
jgi:hypothetical protein